MLEFLCKLVNLTGSYKRKHKGMFVSEHSVVGLLTIPIYRGILVANYKLVDTLSRLYTAHEYDRHTERQNYDSITLG